MKQKTKMQAKPTCPRCGWVDVRLRKKSQEIVCRHCGYIGKKEEFYGKVGTKKYKCPQCSSPSIVALVKTGKLNCLRCGYSGEEKKFLREAQK